MSTIGHTLSARIEAREDRRDGVTGQRHVPPSWVLDAIAERAITGGYTTAQCPVCFTARDCTGGCLCD